MKIADLPSVIELRDRRERIDLLCRASKHGAVGDLCAWHEGNKVEVFAVIDKKSVREAITDGCYRLLGDIDIQLHALGVDMRPT